MKNLLLLKVFSNDRAQNFCKNLEDSFWRKRLKFGKVPVEIKVQAFYFSFYKWYNLSFNLFALSWASFSSVTPKSWLKTFTYIYILLNKSRVFKLKRKTLFEFFNILIRLLVNFLPLQIKIMSLANSSESS